MILAPYSSILATAVISKKRRKIFEAFRAASATTPANKKAVSELGIRSSNLFKLQVHSGVIVRSDDDRYYLDEERLKEVDRFRHRTAIITLIAVLIVVLWIALSK
jgi:hypothetical protein